MHFETSCKVVSCVVLQSTSPTELYFVLSEVAKIIHCKWMSISWVCKNLLLSETRQCGPHRAFPHQFQSHEAPMVLVAAMHVRVYCQHPFIHLDKLVRQIETSIFLKRKQCNGKAWTQIPSTRCPYLSNTLTNNLCSALLNFSFFASFFTVVLLYSTVMWRQYCIQFHA